MKNILIISTILPVEEISAKNRENDFLLQIEKEIIEKNSNITFSYIYILPKTNFLLAFLSKKWKKIHDLKKIEKFHIGEKEILIVRILILPYKFLFRNLLFKKSFNANQIKINDFLKDKKPDFIHALNIENDLILANEFAQHYKIPFAITLHGINQKKIDNLNKKLILKARNIIAISPKQIDLAVSKDICEKDKIKFIPIGVGDQFYNFNPDFSSAKIKFISVCRLVKLKNLDKVILALSRIKGDFEYSIYGDGSEENNLKEMVKNLNLASKIKFYGFVDNQFLPEILANHHVFVMPSFPETLGKAFLEAMALGLPVIASKHSGMSGVITDEVEGFLIEHENQDEIYETIHFLRTNREKLIEMGNNAKEKAENFRSQKIISALYEIYT